MYRFKTKAEFKKELGDSWMYRVPWNPEGNMNYLLGRRIRSRDIVPAHLVNMSMYMGVTMLFKIYNRQNKTGSGFLNWVVYPSMVKQIKGLLTSRITLRRYDNRLNKSGKFRRSIREDKVS